MIWRKKMKRYFDEIIYGTQYYRAPTPLPDEWEGDIQSMGSLGIDAFQIRIQWRQNEKREDEYYFADIDGLLELAEKYNRKVIMKFQLENAPQYLFEKYGATRLDFHGVPIPPASNGAMYVGGWIPCFDNPKVIERAKLFIVQMVNRYKENENIVLWHVWNEPRSRPVGDCCCEHSKQLYRQYMKEEYGTIENLNRVFGTAEDDFHNLATPGDTLGYWDFFQYRKWRASVAIANQVGFVYDTIKENDGTRPIMSHVGFSAVMQDNYHDLSDDFAIAKKVDFYGTSFPLEYDTDSQTRADMNLLCDFQRGVDENYFVHELYPDVVGNWQPEQSRQCLRFKVWTILSQGAKGVVYWQMRAERVGHEEDLSGFVNMDGTEKELTKEVRHAGAVLKENMELFAKAKVEKAEVVIVFDYCSTLMSMIENHVEADHDTLFTFKRSKNPVNYYLKSLHGAYKLFRDLNIKVDIIDSREIEKINGYKLAYFPYSNMLDQKVEDCLVNYKGLLLLDEGFGLRSKNTWVNPNKTSFDQLLDDVKWYERLYAKGEKTSIYGSEVTCAPFKTKYLFCDESIDEKGYIQQKDNVILLGTGMGYSYYDYEESGWLNFVGRIANSIGLKREADFGIDGVKTKVLKCDENKLMYIFNWSGYTQEFKIEENILKELIGIAQVNEDRVRLKHGEVACLLI